MSAIRMLSIWLCGLNHRVFHADRNGYPEFELE